MNKKLLGYLLTHLLIAPQILAYGTGISTHPLEENKGLVTTEFTSFLSKGTGAGMQARYTNKLFPIFTLDAGLGVSSSERRNRFFVGGDTEILPDFDQQPRVSIKASYENANEFSSRNSIFSLTPLVSKGLSVSEYPLYPYAGIPLGLALNSKDNQYHLQTAIVVGTTSKLPFQATEKLLLNLEAQININRSYSGILAGLSLPLN